MSESWPSESEAAALLGTSVKSINRYAAKGLIEMRKRPRPGKKPENTCNPRDLEKLKPAAHLMPEPGARSSDLVPAVREASLAPLVSPFTDLIKTISTAIQTDTKNAEIRNEKLVLTLKEASRSGFSVAFLRRAVDSGRLKCFRDGRRIKIARATLDEFAREGATQ